MSFFITLSLGVMTKIMKMNVQVVIFSAILLSMIVVPNSGEASTPEDGDQDEGSEAEPEPEPTAPEEEEEPTAPEEECTPPEVLNPDTNQCEAPQPPEPCPEGQVRNPETGECESRLPSIEGNCIAVATSEGINASSAAAASVTCINQEINNVIKQQRVGQATTNPIVQSDNMKLGQTQIDSNNSLVIADFYPFRIVGGHVSSNLPIGNEIQVVIGEIDTTGILSKAVALPLIEAKTLTMNDILYSTQLGSVVQGRDIFTGNVVTINSPSIIMLYNIGEVITFSGANSIAYTAIIN